MQHAVHHVMPAVVHLQPVRPVFACRLACVVRVHRTEPACKLVLHAQHATSVVLEDFAHRLDGDVLDNQALLDGLFGSLRRRFVVPLGCALSVLPLLDLVRVCGLLAVVGLAEFAVDLLQPRDGAAQARRLAHRWRSDHGAPQASRLAPPRLVPLGLQFNAVVDH
jgi:hypothetical protein